MNDEEMVQLDDVLAELRRDGRTLAKDLIAGVVMFRVVWILLILVAGVFGYFALSYLYLFPMLQGGRCCYVLTWTDLFGGILSIAGIPYIIWKALRLRKRYLSLQSRYLRLLELDGLLGK